MKNIKTIHLLLILLAIFQPIYCAQDQNDKEKFTPYSTEKYLYNKTVEIRPINQHSIRTIEEDTTKAHYLNWGITRKKITTEIQDNCEKVTKEEWITKYPSNYPTWTGSMVFFAIICAIDLGRIAIESSIKKA